MKSKFFLSLSYANGMVSLAIEQVNGTVSIKKPFNNVTMDEACASFLKEVNSIAEADKTLLEEKSSNALP